jgi:hypothetical protein
MRSQDLSPKSAGRPSLGTLAPLHRVLGIGLLVLAYAPVYRLLDPAVSGPAGAATRSTADVAWSTGLLGTLIVVGLAFAATRLTPVGWLREKGMPLIRPLEGPSSAVFATATGLVAFCLSGSIAAGVFGTLPTSVDEMVQLLHAQALAAGRLALPTQGNEAAWAVQNGVFVPEGWVSIYPPLHTALLAIGLRLGAAWLVGPVLIGIATGLVTASLESLSDNKRAARLIGALLAVTPFWLLLGGTHLSHTSAAAAIGLVLWTAVRLANGGWGWAVALGAAIGMLVSIRPWTGLVLGPVLAVVAFLSALHGERSLVWVRGRLGLVLAGGAPFALVLFWWNNRLFGSPWTLGYSVAFGPAHGLGLGVDPWGNRYGFLEALAYTSADMVQLGAHLFESPLPALAFIGVALLAKPLPRGSGLLIAWAAASIAANAVYWHHGIHMGPRMTFEAIPAWVGLVVLAGASLGAPGRPGAGRWREAAIWSLVLSLLGGAALAPSTVRSHRISSAGRSLAALPLTLQGPATVFVHGSWSSRITARLAARGMRRDSIETALRRNDICAVDQHARAQPGERAAPGLAFEPLPGSPPNLSSRLLGPGNAVLVDPTMEPDSTCLREAGADRLGVVELEPLLWQAPPLPGARQTVVRDLGPARNAALLARWGGTPYLYADVGEGPRLLPYEEGMRLLWGG